MTRPQSPVIRTVVEQSLRVLETYRVDPGLIPEHANGERRITQGGYGDRQLFELVQNAADEIRDEPDGRIHVVLTDTHLYCANQGNPVTPEGAETILRMSMSRKRGGQIGRFGVGVKSVLVVTDTPEFFSSTGSFGFDRAWSYERIRSVDGVREQLGDDFEAPVLRMARELDMTAERLRDQVLDELAEWATTVVRLPLLPGAADRLGKDMHGHQGAAGHETRDEFPSGFHLFSPHVGQVVLEDRRPRPIARRTLRAERVGTLCTIHEERTGKVPTDSRWQVFTHTHEPTEAARRDAGELHDRLTIDLAWAVPAYKHDENGLLTPAGQRRRGQFWAYFPSKYEMSLTGILNGAWKTNEDRQNLLDASPFNVEMIRVAARLVVDSLPELAPAEDPAAYLPLLPGRSREAISWADRYLLEQIWDTAALRPSLPDQDGVLRNPRELRIHPDLSKDLAATHRWLRAWHAYPGRPKEWLHPSVEATALRAGKVGHILERTKQQRADVREWLEALVSDGTAEASETAIRIVADMIESGAGCAGEARKARIVLTEEHGMVAPVPGKVFRRTDEDGLRESLVYVDRALSDNPSLSSALTALGIREADVRGRFVSVLDEGLDSYGPREWTRFWELFHQAGASVVGHEVIKRVAAPMDTLMVRTADEQFRALRDCMLPGAVVTAQRDAGVAVDMRFHSDDAGFFRELGLRDRPTAGRRPEGEPWFEEYREAMLALYCSTLDDRASRPTLARTRVEGAAVGGPLHLLPRLSEEARAAFLRVLPEEGLIENWTLQIGAQVSTRRAVPSPIRWMLSRHGRVETSQGVKTLKEAVGPQLAAYRDVLPVAEEVGVEKARKLRLAGSVENVRPEQWEQLLKKLQGSEDDVFVGSTYALLTRLEIDFPEDSLTRCRIGDAWDTREDGEIAVAANPEEYRSLRAERVPALLMPDRESADLMVEQWGMLRHDDVVSRETRHESNVEAVPLSEEFPTLRQKMGSSVNTYSLLRCSTLEEVVRTPHGARAKSLESARQGNVIKVLDSADRLGTLRAVDRELGLRMGEAGCRAVLDAQTRQEQDEKVRSALKAIREAEDVTAKLELLIGAEALRGRLPAGLMETERQELGGQEPTGRRVAQMAFNAHGDTVLKTHARDIQERFPSAPPSYTGGSAAVSFVADLGLPAPFAGYRAPSLEQSLTVDGPRDFPRLHDYQERLALNIFEMLDRLTPQRAMLSLPTGAGKTRVTAEAVIRWVKQAGDLKGPILWIAQTEELCEQAVQSWRFVWEKAGAQVRLTINRLWSSNEAAPVLDGPQLVVATDAKLKKCLDTERYEWLRGAALVVVDEAHVATSRLYTELLGLLGLTQHRTDRHLLGLTATPFRGHNEEETRRLVSRFGARRLDEGVFPSDDAYGYLQELGVLAQVRHRELTGGTIELSREERESATQFSLLSKAAEQRLADDHDRSRRIVSEIAAMPEDWPVLVFATSVEHAKYLAARLKDHGISASSVDSTTSDSDRRARVDDFRDGKVRVLTNYGVLTQGFDAPATRAVVVARPVYSPNVYQQMIGRGLRGPRNGGKETCLILNVRDTIRNFDTALAFTKFEHLWSKK
ncbi:helicase [Streptosporangium nondiastaticum]|uniref:Helicase n=1 Tax=Streptosporangium nondiastaticum TaxID=35764 RepID=A0A9X7JUZ7_9ACTN|nr:DEAD/DEAH box helicase family protein [Streptosporangium nondiastaticum]PSJ30253.1 helicase [Streptosporangium nondiastaticum]